MELIQMIKALGDESRIKILNILRYCPLCVCEIEEILNMTQSNVSRHLNKLTNAKIVTYYKEAKYVYYKLNEETLLDYPFIKELLENEFKKIEKLKDDYEKTISFKNSGLSCEILEKCSGKSNEK
jgi:ArsR family transcriptional regulator, arsenate/arsenite/antimonite-responsive transcriptional repressor